MKLKAQVGDATHGVEIRREGSRVLADIDGRKYELEASEPEPNVYLFKDNGRINEVYVAPSNADGTALVNVGTREFEVRVIDPKRLRSAGGGHEHGDGHAEIKTAMPGKVVRILKAAGDAVEKGEGVIVVEAMKMQNELKSPKDGSITEIRAAEGDTVGAGDVLVVIE